MSNKHMAQYLIPSIENFHAFVPNSIRLEISEELHIATQYTNQI